MSAIELFDEKMDPRLKYRPVEGPDPNIGFEWTSAEHAIACIDRMLQCEVLVHNGASLIHSLFLCRWLHSPSLLLQSSMESPWTRCVVAYSIAVLRCVARALDAIYLADAVYEEDAILDRFGFDLGDKVTPILMSHCPRRVTHHTYLGIVGIHYRPAGYRACRSCSK